MTKLAKLPALVLALTCAAALLGQDSPAPPPAAPPPPPAAEREPGAATPPASERTEADDGEFIPTEELAPDAAVTFPVDI